MPVKQYLRYIIVFLIICCFSNNLKGQYCSGGIFTTQAEIDAFAVNNPGCIFITGTLSISGSDIVNLNAFKHIKYIYKLDVKNTTSLINLRGLDSVKNIDYIYINNNTALTNLEGLNSLENVDYDFEIINNPNLTNILDLNSLKETSNFYIKNNASLLSLNGLNHMRFSSYLIIENNPLLINLNGLNSLYNAQIAIRNNSSLVNLVGLDVLRETDWSFEIIDNASLVSLDGLDSLRAAYNFITIKNNPVLKNINGLYNLSLASNFYIENNPLLQSLNGLNKLTGLDYLTIIGNSSLVNLEGLNNLTNIEYDITISNNLDLLSLNGLGSLINVASELEINNNPLLTDMQGLTMLTTVRHLNIHHNQNLKNLIGLNHLSNVTDDFYIWNNPSLLNVLGLSSLSNVKDMIISNNVSLLDLEGLNALTDVYTINVYQNPALQNLSGLNNLKTIVGFAVTNNISLKSLNGLNPEVFMQGITVYDNPVLGCCFIVSVIMNNNTGMYTNIHDNYVGCNSVQEIELLGLSGICCQDASYTNIITICQGDSISVGNKIYKITGTYLDTLQSVLGCDSITTTRLNVISSSHFEIIKNICQDDSIIINNHVYKTTGTYSDTLKNVYGCDSIIITNLTVNSNTSFTNTKTLCYGQTTSIGNHIYSIAGTYFDTLANTNGCDSFITTQLTYVDSFIINKTDTICQRQSITIGNYNFSSTGLYRVKLTSINGCDSIIYEHLSVLPLPDIYASVDSSLVPFNTKVQLLATPNNQDYVYSWNNLSQISDISIYNPTAIITATTQFVINVTDMNQCSNSDSITIYMWNDCHLESIYIPSAFSPNNDGVNDCFSLLNTNKLKDFRCVIFNRYGEKIYESFEQNECWNGTFKNSNVLEDTYVYLITFTCSSGQKMTKKGTIAVLR